MKNCLSGSPSHNIHLTYSQPWELEARFSLPDTEHRTVTANFGGEGRKLKCTFAASGQGGGGG